MGKSDAKIAEDLSVDIAHVRNIRSRISKKVKSKTLNHIIVELIENAEKANSLFNEH